MPSTPVDAVLCWATTEPWPGDDADAWQRLAAQPGTAAHPPGAEAGSLVAPGHPSLRGRVVWCVHAGAQDAPPAAAGKRRRQGDAQAVRCWWPFGGDPLALPPRAALDAAALVPGGWDNLFPVLPAWAMRERPEDRARVRDFVDHAWVAARPAPGCHPAAFRQDCAGNVIAHPRACGYGLAWLAFDVDHCFPWARGGLSRPPNLQALQAACNRSKGASDRARESADGPAGYAGGEGAAYASLRAADELPDLLRLAAALPAAAARELRRLIGAPLDLLRAAVPGAEDTAPECERLDRLAAEQRFEASELRRRVWALRDAGTAVDEAATRRFALWLLQGATEPTDAAGLVRAHFGAGGGNTRSVLEGLPDLDRLVTLLRAER